MGGSTVRDVLVWVLAGWLVELGVGLAAWLWGLTALVWCRHYGLWYVWFFSFWGLLDVIVGVRSLEGRGKRTD